MSRRLRVLSAVVVLVVAGTVIAAEAAAAPIHARGTQTVIDETAGTFAMHGTLVGTWFTTSFVPTYDSPTLFAAKGTERFVGCVDTNRNKTCNASEPQGSDALRLHLLGELQRHDGRVQARPVRPPGHPGNGQLRRSRRGSS